MAALTQRCTSRINSFRGWSRARNTWSCAVRDRKARESSARVTEEIHRVDKNQPVADVPHDGGDCARTNQAATMVMALLTSFACPGTCLSALGIYGVLSYSIAHRTREIGLRLALGADQGSVLRLVVGTGARWRFRDWRGNGQ